MKFNASFSSMCLLLATAVFVSSNVFQAAQPAADGAEIFKNNCVMCHGADGKGFPAFKTPNFTDPKWQASTKDKEIKDAIKNGKKGTAMKAFGDKFNDEEISALVAYIRSFKGK